MNSDGIHAITPELIQILKENHPETTPLNSFPPGGVGLWSNLN
jgi:hypothetical protein